MHPDSPNDIRQSLNGNGTHMCLIYSDRQSAMDEVIRFIEQAISADGLAHVFATQTRREELEQGLQQIGCCPDVLSHRLAHSRATELYTPEGFFSKNAMLDTVTSRYAEDSARCDGPIHYVGEMDWVLDSDLEGSEDLLVYEQAVNEVCREHPFSALCQYDATRFEPEFLVEIMKVHPYILVDGMVIPSPTYEIEPRAMTPRA